MDLQVHRVIRAVCAECGGVGWDAELLLPRGKIQPGAITARLSRSAAERVGLKVSEEPSNESCSARRGCADGNTNGMNILEVGSLSRVSLKKSH